MWMILLVVLVAAALLIVLSAYRRFAGNVRRDVETLLADSAREEPVVITEEMLRGLPEPAQRYLRHSGVVGKPIVRTARLRQVGKIRASTGGGWMPFEARQYYTVNPPGFVWEVTAQMAGLPLIRGEDRFLRGKGRMLITAAALKDVVNATGEQLDQGAFMRYLSEMPWFPTSLLSENITWKAVDDHNVEVTLTHGEQSVTGTLSIDDAGQMMSFTAQRYRQANGSYSLDTWVAPTIAYGEFGGLRIPTRGKALWRLEGGDQEYIELEIIDVQCDVAEMY